MTQTQMHSYWKWLAAVFLWWASTAHAATVSDAPLQALNAYIEHSGNCSENLVTWTGRYGQKTMAGEVSREFYYRVLGFIDWGACGRSFFRPILGELRKSWIIFASGRVSQAEFETKEAELINLLFAALQDEKHGFQMVQEYEYDIASRLIDLDQPRQYTDCTFFGNTPRCFN